MKIDIIQLIYKLVNTEDSDKKELLERFSRSKIKDSFLTVEEVLVMYMYYVEERKPNEIALILNRSRSNVYATLQRARDKVVQAKETIKHVNAFRKAIKIRVYSGEDADDVIKRIYNVADEKNVKLPYKSYELKDELRKLKLVDEDDTVIDNTELIILPEIGIFTSGRRVEVNS